MVTKLSNYHLSIEDWVPITFPLPPDSTGLILAALQDPRPQTAMAWPGFVPRL